MGSRIQDSDGIPLHGASFVNELSNLALGSA